MLKLFKYIMQCGYIICIEQSLETVSSEVPGEAKNQKGGKGVQARRLSVRVDLPLRQVRRLVSEVPFLPREPNCFRWLVPRQLEARNDAYGESETRCKSVYVCSL